MDICKEAQWLASLLMVNDPVFAWEIVSLVGEKNQIEALMKAWAWNKERWVERLHTINEKINLFIEAKLLAWQWTFYNLWDEAKSKIIDHLRKAWYEIDRTYQVLTAVSTTELKNKWDLAVILADWNQEEADNIINNFNKHLARYIVAKDKMRLEQWILHSLSDELARTKASFTNTMAKAWWDRSMEISETLTREWWDIAWTTKTPTIEQPSLFKRQTPWVEDFETISQKEARDTVYQYFDSNEVSVTFADNLTTPEWQAAIWAYYDKMITFVENPKKFTPEHEVVHAYIDLFLNEEEKGALYYDALNWHIDEIKEYMRLNWQSSLKEATEDWIADWFVKYVQGKQTFTWKLEDLFKELWYRIKQIFWDKDQVRQLYKDIESKKRPSWRWVKRYKYEEYMWVVDDHWFPVDTKMAEYMKNSYATVWEELWAPLVIVYHTSDSPLVYDSLKEWTKWEWIYWTSNPKMSASYSSWRRRKFIEPWNKVTKEQQVKNFTNWLNEYWENIGRYNRLKEDWWMPRFSVKSDAYHRVTSWWLARHYTLKWPWVRSSTLSKLWAYLWAKEMWLTPTIISERLTKFFDRYKEWDFGTISLVEQDLRYSKITRADLKKIIKQADTPEEAQELLSQKLLELAKKKVTLKEYRDIDEMIKDYWENIDVWYVNEYRWYVNMENPLIVRDNVKKPWNDLTIDWYPEAWEHLKTREVAVFAREHWYDWVIIKQIMDTWWGEFWRQYWDVYIWFNENQFKHIENRNPSTDKRMFYKRARVEDAKEWTEESITQYKIKTDPILQAEYQSRINSIKTLQTMIANDLDTLKNLNIWLYKEKDWLFWEVKISELWSDVRDLFNMYRKEWDKFEEMTLSQLRNRIESAQDKFRNAHRQKNVIAAMEADRVNWNKEMLSLFKVPEVKVEWQIAKEPIWVTSRNSLWEIIRSYDWENEPTPNPKNTIDPMDKTTLPPEWEKILKENIQKDLEQVKKWEAPSNTVKADSIWKEFYEKSDDVKEREMNANNYLIWKIYLWEWDDVLESALKWINGKNADDALPLTREIIDWISDLWQLEQIVYTHIWDLIYDKTLRELLKDKQYELWVTATSSSVAEEWRLLSKARSIQNTSEFLQAWWLYSDVTLYDRVWNTLKSMFPDIKQDINNRDLYDQFTSAVTNFSSKADTSTTTKVWWKEMTAADLVRWIWAIAWDTVSKDMTKLKANPRDQLKLAAKRLFNIWSEKEAQQAERRINNLFNSIETRDFSDWDITKMVYATTSDVNIEWEITDSNIVFYNYRDWIYAWSKQTTYWEFMDELAKQNSIVVDSEHNMKEVFNVREIPSDTKYIVVNDINWRDDVELNTFINKAWDDIQVIRPRWWMMWNYYVENWKLKFKTSYNKFYNEITRNATSKTLWAYAKNIEEVTEQSAQDLEDKALEYFRTMMWLNLDWAPKNKAEYKAWIVDNLRMMTWLPIASDADKYNSQEVWKMASDILRYQFWATGRYTKVIKDVDQTVADIATKFDSDRQWFFEDIKAIVGWDDDTMERNADLLRDVYMNYAISPSIETKIQNKWIMAALANWWEFNQINIDLFNSALREDDVVWTLWPIIYWAREYTNAEQEALKRLWDDILSVYVFTFWDNLTKQWYLLPLISPATAIRKYIKWESIVSDWFVQALITKNWLPENSATIEWLFKNAMPTDLWYQMPASMLLDTEIELPNIVVEEVPNMVIPTNYNQLSSIITKSSKWWWITWWEESILQWILANYYKTVERNVKAWTMTPTLAQQLKLQAWWALDMAEQDLIIAKYNSFLTIKDREWLMWWKYKLRIATTESELDEVKEWNQAIMQWYRRRLWEIWKKWIKSYDNIEKAEKDLIENWKIMTTVNGNVVSMDVHDMLIEKLNTLPDWLRWVFDNFKSLSKNDIKWIPNKTAYSIIKAIDLARNASARGNLYSRLMYKQNPTLANIDFFRRYTLNSDWIPMAISNNAAKLVDSSISDWLDTTIKQNIMLDISQVMKKKWKLTDEELTDIVNNEISWYRDNETIANHYKNIFRAYTYLTDIPKDIKNTINWMLDVQLKEIREDLSKLDEDFYDWILNSRIILTDWSDLSLRDVLDWNIDSYKWNLFIEKWSDWVYRNVNMKETTSNELWLTENQKIEYSDAMYSLINQLDQVNDVERKMNSVIFNNARKILSKYTTTKRILDADYLIWWQNDLLRNLIKSNAFSWWWKLWWDHDLISKAWDLATKKSLFNEKDWNVIRDYYYTYYAQSLDTLNATKVTNDLQATALEMAKYFKKIEQTLGSADWALWASTNTELNRAFWKIWTIILRVNTSSEVHSLMNLIWNNQILGFFKFAQEWDWAYYKLFSSLKASKQKFTWIYYIRDLEEWDLKSFNQVFNSNFSMKEFKIIMQALWWYQLWSPARSWLTTIIRWINSSSALARALMSYPFQLFTIAPQSIAYNLKANAYKRALWIEDMDAVNKIREFNDILTSEYIELNPWSKTRNWLWIYWWKDVDDLIKNENVEMDDSIMELFWKSYNHAAKNYKREQFVALFDATRDNANNIIDALMAQKFKNLAFVKALQNNSVMPFHNAEAFQRFMNDVDIPQSLKDEVMDSIRIYSWRIFKDMLWTWFSWLDKIYASWAFWEILVGLMNAINFRWAWWLNMYRQTFEKIFSVAKTLRFIWDEKAMSQAIEYIKNTPEFSNLSQAMFNDMVWMWKLARFSDNGKQPDDESEADFMDFCEWALNNIDLVSQQWQGIMSFWPMRPVISAAEAEMKHIENPEIYWSNAWIWAFINTFASNFWRNWKPWNFVVSALRAAQADWDMSRAWNYAAENFYTLSAWTLRYMLEEWYNAYWANTPLVYEIWWIPSFLAWEQWEGSDTAFLYQMRQEETANYLANIRSGEDWYTTMWLLWQLWNYSQLFSLIKESTKLVWTALWKEDWKSSKSTYDLSDLDEAYADLPEWQEWRNYWFIIPKHEPWYESYYDSIIYSLTESKAPGGSKFYNWVAEWLETWYIDWEEKYYNKMLEEFYTRIEEKDPGALRKLINDETLMSDVATDTKKAIQTSLSFMEKELALFNWDAEYNKYAALLYKWIMSNVMYDELDKFAERKQAELRSKWILWPKEKLSASKIKKVEPWYREFKEEFVDSHWDELRVADTEAIDSAMATFLAKKSKEASDKFFTKRTFKDSDWNEYDKYYFKSNIKSQVQQLIDFEKAMRDWEWERAVVEWTALTKTFSYDHTVSPEVALHIFNRIKNSDTLSDKMKLEAMTEFLSNNLDAFTYDSKFAEENPEIWNEVKWHYNEIVYHVNRELIQKANDYALSLESDNEKKWSWLAKKVASISNKLAKIQESTSWWSSSWRNRGSYTMTWVKAPILDPSKVINDYGKTPTINFNPKFSSKWYTPKTDLGWNKQQSKAKPVKVKKVKVKEKDIEVI